VVSIRETDRSDRLDGGISSSSTVSSFLRVDILLRAKFVAYAVLEQVERFERAGAAPAPDQGTVPGEESARPGAGAGCAGRPAGGCSASTSF